MIIFTLIGAFIGAGFASGQEIYSFFYKYGKNGIIGIILFGAILGIIIYKTLNIIYKNNISTYKKFLDYIFTNNLKISQINNILVNFFLCISFFIMISGFGTYFYQSYGINKVIGSLILIIISFFIFLKNIENIAEINKIIIPILIVLILILGIKNILNMDINQIGKNLSTKSEGSFIIQAILYASYNLILLIPIMINLKKYIINNRNIIKTSVMTGIIISTITILTFLLLINIDEKIDKIEMPIIYVIGKKFSNYNFMYGIVMLISIFTTAISVGSSFLNNICKQKEKLPKFAFFMSIVSILTIQIKFSTLVNFLFPVFGYLGLLQIYFILKKK